MRGFTLIEVLVALAIFSIAAIALLHAQSETLRSSQALRDRSFALMVADNRLVESMSVSGRLSTGRENGVEEMANRRWAWQRTISATQNPNVLRVDVVVQSEDGSQDLAQLSGFRGLR